MRVLMLLGAVAFALALALPVSAGEWQRGQFVDPLTDAWEEQRYVTATSNSGQAWRPPQLTLVCQGSPSNSGPSELDVVIIWQTFLDSDVQRRKMDIRFDDDAPQSKNVDIFKPKNGAVAFDWNETSLPDGKPLEARLLASERFVARIEDYSGDERTAVWNTADLADVIDGKFKERCGSFFDEDAIERIQRKRQEKLLKQIEEAKRRREKESKRIRDRQYCLANTSDSVEFLKCVREKAEEGE